MYKIIRFYNNSNRRQKVLFKNVTLEVAQLHCRDPKTRKEGVYFDGYDEM